MNNLTKYLIQEILDFKEQIFEIGEATSERYKTWIRHEEEWSDSEGIISIGFKTESGMEYRILLQSMNNNLNILFHVDNINDEYDYSHDEYAQTNKGELYKVMATVADETKKFINKYPNIENITYETDDHRRHNLYTKFIEKALGRKVEPYIEDNTEYDAKIISTKINESKISTSLPYDSGFAPVEEAKQIGLLYHYTSTDGLKNILSSNNLNSSEEIYLGNKLYYVSFTRNKNFHKKGMKWQVKTDYRITLDGDKLSNKYKIQPFSYIPGWNYKDNWEYDWLEDEPENARRDFFNATGDYDEQEERISFKNENSSIVNIKDYILTVDKVKDLQEALNDPYAKIISTKINESEISTYNTYIKESEPGLLIIGFKSNEGIEYSLNLFETNGILDIDFTTEEGYEETNKGEFFKVINTVIKEISKYYNTNKDIIKGFTYTPIYKDTENTIDISQRDKIFLRYFQKYLPKIKITRNEGTITLMLNEDKIPGGLAQGKSLNDIANRHKINMSIIKSQLQKGIKIEMEHTTSKEIAKEIAKDHIWEDPKYYDKLQKIEENMNNKDEFIEHLKLLTKNLKENLNLSKLPKIKLIENDKENSNQILGKTAYYDPDNSIISLYTHNRHPKDILRSYAHEMIHHKQNLEGRLNNINTTNTNEDGNLLGLEKEAYEKGNILFRNWEDNIKNQNLNEVRLERRKVPILSNFGGPENFQKIKDILTQKGVEFKIDKFSSKTSPSGFKIKILVLDTPFADRQTTTWSKYEENMRQLKILLKDFPSVKYTEYKLVV